MYLLVITGLLFIAPQANASLRELLNVALNRNLTIEQSRVGYENSLQDNIIANSRYSFRIDLESSYLDSNFERDPFSLVSANEAWSHELTLAKPFSWGGELLLSNTHRQLIPKQSIAESFLFEQRLTYSQDLGRDFLGRASQNEVEATVVASEVAKLELTVSEREQMLNVARLYVEGASQNGLRELEQAALERSKKRLSYVSRQVRDGLRERVDRLRSEGNVLVRESALRDLDEALWRLREELGALIAANVEKTTFNAKSLDMDWTKPWRGWHLKENTDRQLLVKRLEALSLQAKSRHEQNFADIKLITSYGTNNWELERSKAFSKGSLGQDSDEWSIGVQVSMPWGNDASKAELAKVEASKRMLERYKENWNEVLIHTARTMGERHKILAQNLKTARERVSLARKALDAYNDLYSKGRADLEQVITAEEQLIADQKLVVSSRQSLVLLTLEAQALAGRLPQFLLREIDL